MTPALVAELTKTATHFKVSNVFLVGLSSFFSFVATELTTNNIFVAILFSGASALATSLVAYFAARPKIIVAQTSARDADSQRWQREASEAVERIHESYRATIGSLRHNSLRYQQIIGLERKSKHAVLGEWEVALRHINDLRELLIRNNVADIPTFRAKNYQDVIGPSDEAIAEILANLPVEEQRQTAMAHYQRQIGVDGSDPSA